MKLLKRYSFALVLVIVFLLFLTAQSYASLTEYNVTRTQQGSETVSYMDYAADGGLGKSVVQYWREEFIAIVIIVLVIGVLREQAMQKEKFSPRSRL